jgi:hypothetical protein
MGKLLNLKSRGVEPTQKLCEKIKKKYILPTYALTGLIENRFRETRLQLNPKSSLDCKYKRLLGLSSR